MRNGRRSPRRCLRTSEDSTLAGIRAMGRCALRSIPAAGFRRGWRAGDLGEGPWRIASELDLKTSVALIAAVAIAAAAYQASAVFAPLALAFFIIALVWPMRRWLQARMPALIALLITMTVRSLSCSAWLRWWFGASAG